MLTACSLMIAEIVSNGMLSLPAALAVVGIVPGVILIAFLGIFALYTALVLVDFKLRHPQVHNMGDAGFILGGPILREILSTGTVIFAVCATGSQLLAGQIALTTLSGGKLCLMLYTGIFTIPMLLLSFPRTLDQLSLLSILSCICILVAGLVGIAAAGALESPKPIKIASSASFFDAFLAITNPVFAYAGHFMFFILISEMKHPADAKKAAWTLQVFATSFYCIFACVMYVYLGNDVLSPAFSSLPEKWYVILCSHPHPTPSLLPSHTFPQLLTYPETPQGKSNLRPRPAELPHRRIPLLPHRRETLLHPPLPHAPPPPARTHSPRLVHLDRPHYIDERRRFRVSRRRPHLRVYSEYSRVAVRQLVYVWDRGRVLVV